MDVQATRAAVGSGVALSHGWLWPKLRANLGRIRFTRICLDQLSELWPVKDLLPGLDIVGIVDKHLFRCGPACRGVCRVDEHLRVAAQRDAGLPVP